MPYKCLVVFRNHVKLIKFALRKVVFFYKFIEAFDWLVLFQYSCISRNIYLWFIYKCIIFSYLRHNTPYLFLSLSCHLGWSHFDLDIVDYEDDNVTANITFVSGFPTEEVLLDDQLRFIIFILFRRHCTNDINVTTSTLFPFCKTKDLYYTAGLVWDYYVDMVGQDLISQQTDHLTLSSLMYWPFE